MRWPQEKQIITREKRAEVLRKAHYNIFNILSPDVYIDLLTDSGTGRMSEKQWEALEGGDESYAGSTSALRLKQTIRNLFEVPYVLLVNQGRAAENVFGNVMQTRSGLRVVGNTPFDTTRTHIERRGGIIIDVTAETPITPMQELSVFPPFLGDINIENLYLALGAAKSWNRKIAYVLITATCNSNAGQPVSLKNIQDASRIAHSYDVSIFLDLARYAENAFFIKQRENKWGNFSVADIVGEMVKPVDGFLASGKKDALGNIGGFLGLKSRELAEKIAQQIRETIGLELVDGAGYGGMSGRDIEALNQGILESTDEQYLESRILQVRKLAEELLKLGVPVLPPGGHAVFVDAGKLLPHIPWDQFPGHALALALYLEGGIRSVEVGSLILGRDPTTRENRKAPQELTRLAIPRRVYAERDMRHVVKTFAVVQAKAYAVPGVTIDPGHEHEPRHFAARFLWEGFI